MKQQRLRRTTLMAIVTVASAFQATHIHAQQTATHKTFPQPVYRADDFIDSIGINGSPIQTNVHDDGPHKGAGKTFDPQVYYDLGIRYYRLVLQYALTREDQPQQVLDAWKKSGARAMLFLGHNNTKNPLDALPLLKKYDIRALAEVEGPNEPNNKFPPQDLNHKYKGKTDEAATALYMQEFYEAMKADSQLKSLPVVAYSPIFTDYNLAKGHTGFDFSNVHSYQGYGVPSSSLEMNITRFNNIYPPGSVIKPFVPTETGYNVEGDVSNGTFKTGSYRAQSLNIPMQLAEYFRHGIRRTYLFAIHNADGYGLLESDLKTKRPSYFALKNFLDQIREAKWNPSTLKWEGAKTFTPRALLFTTEGAPETVHSLTLQRSTGEYSLLLWNEVRNFDQDARKDIVNAPVPVTLKFQTPVTGDARVLIQDDKGGYSEKVIKISNNTVKLEVPSSVMIVKLKPGAQPRIANPAAPQGLKGVATSHRADVSWNAVANAAGHFIFRNGWHIATTTSTQMSDQTSWLRPGLGYNYEVQAFNRYGGTSPRAKTVVFTPNGRPDLIVTKIEADSQNLQANKPVKLRATVKNIGDGPTPWDSTLSATFFVNGQFTCWGTLPAVLNPGEEKVVEVNGGPGGVSAWTPKENGAFVVRAFTDDINRVPGEIEEANNNAEATFVVGQQPRGELSVSSLPKLGGVNLSQEGTLDWIAWGQGEGKEKAEARADIVTKSGGPKLFGALEEFGNGHLASTPGSAFQLNWTGGAGIAEKQNTYSGLWWNGVGHGVRFTVDATTQTRVLKLYVNGINGPRGKLEASLSDNSAPTITSTTWDANRGNGNWAPVPDNFAAVYTIRFRATSPHQKLTVSWSMENEPNPWNAQLRLQAATLADAG